MTGSEQSNADPKVELVAQMAIDHFQSIDKRERFLAKHKEIEPQVRDRIAQLTARRAPTPEMQPALV